MVEKYSKSIFAEHEFSLDERRFFLSVLHIDNKLFYFMITNDRSNITGDEREALQSLAQDLLSLSDNDLALGVKQGKFIEVCRNDND